MKNIVLNIPHCSINGVYDDKFGKWTKNPLFINHIVNKWTDWHTDYLFQSEKVKSVVFPYSRFVCDVERLENDEMEEIGQGIAYTNFMGYKRVLSEENIQNIMTLWHQHQDNLRKNLNEDSILINCHSFPSDIENDCDICIGFNDDWSYDEDVVLLIKHIFEKHGYKTALNHPYSNSITPKTDFHYTSVKIEVNKRVYMNEKILILNPNVRQWMRWGQCINEIYDRLLK